MSQSSLSETDDILRRKLVVARSPLQKSQVVGCAISQPIPIKERHAGSSSAYLNPKSQARQPTRLPSLRGTHLRCQKIFVAIFQPTGGEFASLNPRYLHLLKILANTPSYCENRVTLAILGNLGIYLTVRQRVLRPIFGDIDQVRLLPPTYPFLPPAQLPVSFLVFHTTFGHIPWAFSHFVSYPGCLLVIMAVLGA